MPKNLTLSIDEDLLDKARVLAAMKRTSVNEMVRGFLQAEVAREAGHARGLSAPISSFSSAVVAPQASVETPATVAPSNAHAGVIRLTEKLSRFDDRWSPKTVATYNANDVMVVKIEGDFHWHKQDDTDDLFYVIAGRLEIDIEGEETRTLLPGDLTIVPKGKMHCPRTINGVVHLLLIEPSGTPNSGDRDTASPRQFL